MASHGSSRAWPGYTYPQGKLLTKVRRSLTAYGVKDSMGTAGSITENVVADLQEAGYSIVDRKGDVVIEGF